MSRYERENTQGKQRLEHEKEEKMVMVKRSRVRGGKMNEQKGFEDHKDLNTPEAAFQL